MRARGVIRGREIRRVVDRIVIRGRGLGLPIEIRVNNAIIL